MAAVAALYHQVRGDKGALPCACHGGSDLIPRGAVGLTDGAGIHALDAAQFDGVIADDPADVFHGALHGIGGIEPHVADHGGAGRDDIAGLAALHLGKGDGGAHQGVQLAALLFAQVIQNTAEQPQVGKDHAVKEGGMTAEGIEHLGGRGGDVHGKGVIFHLAAGIRQYSHGGVGLGRGGVTAGGGNAVLQIHHALFGNTDERAGLLDAGEYILDHRAALIHDKLDIDIVLLEPVDDIDGAGAVDLLLTGEGKVNVLLRLEALRNQMIGGSQHAVKGDLGIKGAASPQHAVLNDALEGGLFPVLLLHRDNIKVRHHDRSLIVGLARPVEQQAAVRQAGEGAFFINMGI